MSKIRVRLLNVATSPKLCVSSSDPSSKSGSEAGSKPSAKSGRPGGKPGNELPLAFPERPLWILEPRLVANPPQLLGKPERIEAGWWSDEDSSRDYFIAVTPEGSRWWLYREAGTWRWYLQGIWA